MGRKGKSKIAVARKKKERMRIRRHEAIASMGLAPQYEEKPLAQRLASPSFASEKKPLISPSFASSQGSLSISNGDMVPTSDSLLMVCTPPSVPSLKLDVAGQVLVNKTPEDTQKMYRFRDDQKLMTFIDEQKQNNQYKTILNLTETKLNFTENEMSSNIETEMDDLIIPLCHGETPKVICKKLLANTHTLRSPGLVIQGSFHQGNLMFRNNAGKQCVPNCLIAIVYSKLKQIAAWDKTCVDSVLINGNNLYTRIHGNNDFLFVSDLPSQLKISNMVINCIKKDSYGALIDDKHVNLSDFPDVLLLNQAIRESLSGSDGCFITVKDYTSIVIKQNGKLYLFDSHARNVDGLQDSCGSSIVIELESVQHLYQLLCNFVKYDITSQFEVTGITVYIVDNERQSFQNFHIEHDKEVPGIERIDSTNANTNLIDLPSDISLPMDGKMVSNDLTIYQENENDDVEMTFDCRTIFYFKPLDFYSKRKLCGLLNISHNDLHMNICSSEGYLGNPSEIKSITGDGNCFFRAISFSISQRQKHYSRVRQMIVDHCLSIAGYMESFLESPYKTVEEHICCRKMRDDGTWATALEILVAADLFKCDIYIFYNEEWIKYSSCQIFPHSKVNDRAIYLKHIANIQHYEVVLSVDQTFSSQVETVNVAMKRKFDENELSIVEECSYRKKVDLKSKYEKEKEKYRTDPHFRNIKTKKQRIKYNNDAQYRTNHLQSSTNKYHANEEHRTQIKEASMQKYAMYEEHRTKVKDTSKQKYAINKKHRTKVKEASIQKYSFNEEHRTKVKEDSIQKYALNEDHRTKVKEANIQKYAINEEYRTKEKQVSIQKYAINKEHRTKVKEESIQKYAINKEHRTKVKEESIQKYAINKEHRIKVNEASKQKYAIDEKCRNKIKTQTIKRRNVVKEENKNIAKVIENFRKNVEKGPEFICACCFRLCFQNQVIQCQRGLYKTNNVIEIADTCISEKYLHKCSGECKDQCVYQETSRKSLWICFTCHRKIIKGNVPAESFANNMELEDIPQELARLNQLEQHLVSLNIPFMKILALPKGGQKAVHGPCVCVPSDISKTTSSLPRSADESCIVKVKLKRKLQYKGYEEYQFIDTKHLEDAIYFLKEKNEWYSDIVINEKWVNPIPPPSEIENYVEEIGQETHTEKTEVFSDDVQTKSDKDELEPEVDSYLDNSLQGIQLDTCLQPANIGQEALDTFFDQEFNLSPAEGNTPISLLKEKGIEAKTFPVHYPTGKNAVNEERDDKLSLLRYFNLRLTSVENRFARDTSYIFFSQYMSELERVMSNVQISLRKGSAFSNGKKVTRETLCDNDNLNGLFRKDEAIKYLKPVRGTPPYWQATQKDIFAMIRQLGIPTFFCSFSSADFRWKEIVQTIMKQQDDNRNVSDLSWNEKCKILTSNPVTTARMFDRRFHMFLKNVIISPAEPIGHVKDYFYRVEFQQRGSPHTHCLFWIEGAPKFEEDADETVTNFIDKYITCQLPAESDDEELANIVRSVQQHSKNHSKSCKKKGTVCRFNFPRPPSEKTFISRSLENDCNDDIDENECDKRKTKDKKVLEVLWEIITNSNEANLTANEIFDKAEITQEDFEVCFRSITTRNTVVLKRDKNEMFINQYNPDLLRAWDANIDIQYILDAYSCVVYIISYISKSERELGLLLQQTRNEAADGNLDAQQTMKKIGTSYFHFRELSAQEAVFRVIGLNLKECSRKVEFIPVGDNPCKMSIPLKSLHSTTKRLKIKTSTDCHGEVKDDDDDDDDIWMTSIYDKYKNRPEIELFENMCLASFCSSFSSLSESQVPKKINENTTFRLQNKMGYIRKRTRTADAVIRYPRFSVETSPDLYYQSILQLFLPHKCYEQLKPPQFDTYENFYQSGCIRCFKKTHTTAVKTIVDDNMAKFVKIDKELDIAEEKLATEEGCKEDAWAQLCPENETERLECINDGKISTVLEEETPEVEIPDMNKTNSVPSVSVNLVKTCFSKSDVLPLLRRLNKKQKQIFYKIRDWCNLKVNGKNPQPFHVFVTGGAGTGKSHLIKCLYYETTKILARCSQNPDDLTVLLTAPTGTAAFTINGLTIHSALSIFKSLSTDKASLSEDKLNTLRSKLENLEILIIDEISMVNKRLLFFIHERLRQIKKTKEKCPYGGVSIIAVGDFFQLPPVKSKKSDKLYVDDKSNPLNYLWNGLFSIVELDEIMRQKEDQLFAKLLNKLRTKDIKEPLERLDLEMLMQCMKKGPDDALHIFATNAELRQYNNEMIMKLPDAPILIEAEDFDKNKTTGRLIKRKVNFPQKDICLPTSILLAKGARVMMIKNEAVNDGLVNGVMGTVFLIPEYSKGSLPNVIYINFDNEKVGKSSKLQKKIEGKRCVGLEPSMEDLPFKNGKRKQYPLQLSWACTVHKVQGLTVSEAVVDLNNCFAYGQSYVALSRVTSKEGLNILPIEPEKLNKKIYCDPDILQGINLMDDFLSENVITSSRKPAFSIVYHNIQGLKEHHTDLKVNSDFKDSNYICLTETWLQSISEDVNIPDYDFNHLPRSAAYTSTNTIFDSLKNMIHGGVGVYVKSGSEYEEIKFRDGNLECICFKIPSFDVLVVTVYRTQKYITRMFLENFSSFLDDKEQKCKNIIVVGDFNEDIKKDEKSILNFMSLRGFKQIVKDPTTEGYTIIDHVYVKGSLEVEVQIIPTYYSYHNGIHLDVHIITETYSEL